MGSCLKGCLIFLFIAGAVLIGSLVGTMFHYVELDENGLDQDMYKKQVDESNTYGPGRYTTGVNHDFVRFPRFYQTLSFLGGDAIAIRTTEGLDARVEATALVKLPKENVVNVWRKYGRNYLQTLNPQVRQALANAANYLSIFDLLYSQEVVSPNMTRAAKATLEPLGFDVLGVFLTNIVLPAQNEMQALRVVIADQNATVTTLRNVLNDITTQNAQILRQAAADVRETLAQANSTALILKGHAAANATSIKLDADTLVYTNLKQHNNLTNSELLEWIWTKTLNKIQNASLVVDMSQPTILSVPASSP